MSVGPGTQEKRPVEFQGRMLVKRRLDATSVTPPLDLARGHLVVARYFCGILVSNRPEPRIGNALDLDCLHGVTNRALDHSRYLQAVTRFERIGKLGDNALKQHVFAPFRGLGTKITGPPKPVLAAIISDNSYQFKKLVSFRIAE